MMKNKTTNPATSVEEITWQHQALGWRIGGYFSQSSTKASKHPSCNELEKKSTLLFNKNLAIKTFTKYSMKITLIN